LFELSVAWCCAAYGSIIAAMANLLKLFSPCEDEDYLFYPVYCLLADSRCTVKPSNARGIGLRVIDARTRVPQGLKFETDIEHVIAENVWPYRLLTVLLHEESTFSID
jgi:hypothetical protein